MTHHCHALGCKKPCPRRWLMCPECWSKVPPDLQAEVYRTVKLRGPHCDASWAPWWHAQAQAIHAVGLRSGLNTEQLGRWLARELAFAGRLRANGAT